MNANNTAHIPGLPVAVSEGLADAVALAAVKVFGKPEHPLWGEIHEAITKRIFPPRQRKDPPPKLNPGQIRRAIREEWDEHPELAETALKAWANQEHKLIQACAEWLTSHPPDLALEDSGVEEKGHGEENCTAIFHAIAKAILEKNPNLGSEEEIRLAVGYLWRQPSRDSKYGKDTEMGEDKRIKGSSLEETQPGETGWEEMLDRLRQIQAEDKCWNTFEAFVEAARSISTAKQAERIQEAQIRQLTEALDLHQAKLVQWASYLQVQGVEAWSAEMFPAEQGPWVIEGLETLCNLLDDYERLVNNPRTATRQERLEWEAALHKIEDQVLDSYRKVEALKNPPAVVKPEVRPETETTKEPEPTETVKSAAGLETKAEEEMEPAQAVKLEIEAEEGAESPAAVELERGLETGAEEEMEPVGTIEVKAAPEDEAEPPETVEPVIEPESGAGEDLAPMETIEPEAAPQEGIEPSEAVEPVMGPESEVEKESAQAIRLAAAPQERIEPPEIIEPVIESGTEVEEELEPAEAVGPEIELGEEPFPTPTAPSEPILPETANVRLVELLDEQNLPLAYWLAWGMEQQGQAPTVASWITAAAQGALWHLALWPNPPARMLACISELVRPEARLFEAQETEMESATPWLTLAAGLYLGLVDPGGGWESWLDIILPHNVPHLAELVQLVRSTVPKGIYLDPVQVRSIFNIEEVDRHIQSLAQEAKQWQQQARTRSGRMLRASQVWQNLIRSPHGELYQLAEPAAADRRSAADEVLHQLEGWKDRASIDRHIQKIDQELRQRKDRPIVGEARDQIIAWTEDICNLVKSWATAAQQRQTLQTGTNWAIEQIRQLCESLNTLLPEAYLELTSLTSESEDRLTIAGLNLLIYALKGLQAILTPQGVIQIDSWPKPPQIVWRPEVDPQASLLDLLSFSLLFYPELELENNGLPVASQAASLVALLANAQSRSTEQAIQGWLDSRDYRFTGTLLNDLHERGNWAVRIQEALHSDIRRLEHPEMEQTVITVEQALFEGLIAEGEHTDYRSRIESVRRQLRNVDLEAAVFISVRDLSRRLQQISHEISSKRNDRQANQQDHWQKLRLQISRLAGGDEQMAQKIETAVENSLKEQDLRLTGEYLAHLENVLSGEKSLVRSLFESPPARETMILLGFQDLLPDLVEILARSPMSLARIREHIQRDQKTLPGFPNQSLPSPRREEVSRALDAWQRLKMSGQNNPQANLPLVETLMSYLGFRLAGTSPVSYQAAAGGQTNFQHWRVAADDGSQSPAPQFGSQRLGLYDVIGVWDRPGVEEISAQVSSLMQHTGRQPTILLYFHYLTPARRETLFEVVQKEKLPILVIDEALIVFLAGEPDSRLNPMFYCTLPYSILNPYYPTGPVPPEIFKGRRDLVDKLIDPFGPAIVYGGRQLGKSALLRQVQREMEKAGQIVIFLDIKLVGDPASGKDYLVDLRDRLVKELVKQKLLEPGRAGLDLDRLLGHIQQLLAEKGKRMLLLLDEADHFLDADSLKSFFVVQKLKTLMDQTGRRFKMVLAGLHSVQRFKHISNQPLAHLDPPIEIGPLDPEPARELLLQPLHALGFRFGKSPRREDASLVLHILSYTNYHPGLIQLFGQKLVEHMQKNRPRHARLPLMITRDDVDAVYRKKDVREGIYDRFKLTLALDTRYEAIALALILEQWQDQNGFDRLYTAKQLHEKAAGWWPEAFDEKITPDRFNGFLDEMRGLGVLSASQDNSSYRLRSPNLVSLMGTYDQIWERMEFLVSSTPPGERALESNRSRMKDSDSFSPLTFGQEQSLNHAGPGVGLFFGSSALGLSNLDGALQRLISEETGAWCAVRVAARSSRAIQQQLENFVHENPHAASLIAFRELDGNPDELVDQVLEAVRFCAQTRRPLRVYFALDPLAAWQWFQLPKETRERIEERVGAVLALKRWDRLGIRQRLEMETWNSGEIITSDRLIGKILDMTSGWPCLLDEFIQNCRGADPEPVLEEFRQGLYTPGSPLGRSFTSALGIYESLPRQVVAALLNPEVQDMIQKEPSYVEVLGLVIEKQTSETLQNAVEYLKRMSVVTTEPFLSLEPVVSRLWHGA